MKKYLYLLLVSFVLAFACEKPEPEPEPVVGKVELQTEGTVILSDDGGSKQIAFSATLDWTAVSSAQWLTVDHDSGEAGDATITLRALANPTYDPRSATVTIKSGEDAKSVQVTQKQKGALLLTETTFSVSTR